MTDSEPRGRIFEWLLALGAAGIWYGLTVCPTIGFGDTAIMIDAMRRCLLSSHVNNHPLTVLCGYIFSFLPFGNPALQGNLVSVFFGSLTVATAFLCARLNGLSRLSASLTTACLAVSHSLWWHSTIVENYAASGFCVALAYLAVISYEQSGSRRWLLTACTAAGFAIFNHVQNSMLCVAVAIVGIHAAHTSGTLIKTTLRCFGAACIGLLPWGVLVAKDAVAIGLQNALRDAFVGKFESTFFAGDLSVSIRETLFIFWNQSPLLFIPICGAIGILTGLRSRISSTSLLAIVHIGSTIVVFAGYPTWDKFAFLLPAFVGTGILASRGVRELQNFVQSSSTRSSVWRYVPGSWMIGSIVAGPLLYASVSGLARNPDSIWSMRYNNRYSENLYDQASFIANPNKRNYREVEQFAEALFAKLPSDSFFLDDDSRTYYPLADYFQRYLGRRQDVSFLLVNSWGFDDWGMSADGLADVAERAYQLDKPFFVASVGYPYAKFFSQVATRIPVAFERYDVEPGRWIYRMRTLRDDHPDRNQRKELEQRGLFEPLRLSGMSGEINVRMNNLLFSSGDTVVMQEMTSFGPSWVLGDHLFVGANRPGSAVDVVVESGDLVRKNLTFRMTSAPDFGDVTISVDGEVVAQASLYSATVGHVDIDLTTTAVDTQGKVISLRVTGKDPRSLGFNLGLDSVRFRPLSTAGTVTPD